MRSVIAHRRHGIRLGNSDHCRLPLVMDVATGHKQVKVSHGLCCSFGLRSKSLALGKVCSAERPQRQQVVSGQRPRTGRRSWCCLNCPGGGGGGGKYAACHLTQGVLTAVCNPVRPSTRDPCSLPHAPGGTPHPTELLLLPLKPTVAVPWTAQNR